MITVELLMAINALLPGADERSQHLRKLVRLLADAGGQLSIQALTAALGTSFSSVQSAARGWDGLRFTGLGNGATVHLAPWVRKAVSLPVDSGELLSDLADDDEPSAYHRPVRGDGAPAGYGTAMTTPHLDPLASVRATLARCKNISTVQQALEHALPETIRVRIAGD